MTKAYGMKWDQTRKNNLLSHKNDQRYYTIDISLNNDNDNTMDAYRDTAVFYTDLPGPHFDIDDDPAPFGNPYADETEVTMLRPDLLQVNQEYQFISYWEILAYTGTTFEWNSQLSETGLFAEYSVAYYEPHFSKTFPWWR